MAKRKIVWTETAAFQRRAVLAYWVKRNQSTAYSVKLIEVTKSRLKSIANNPLANKEAEIAATRVAAMGHFSIFYKVDSTQIVITAFWDNRQDPQKLYEQLRK